MSNESKKELKVELSDSLVKDLKTMSVNSGKSESEIIEIALKRFRSSHADYMGIKLDYP